MPSVNDFFVASAELSAPVPAATQQAVIAVLNVASRAAPDWLPSNLPAAAYAAFTADPPTCPRLAYTVPGLSPEQQAGWRQIYQQMQPITNAILTGALAQAQALGNSLAGNVSFWNTISRITADIATAGLNEAWQAFWDTMQTCKLDHQATQTALDTAASYLEQQGSQADPADVQTQTTLENQHQSILSRIISTIAPLGPDVRAQAGLGSPLYIVAGVAASVVIAITASVAALGAELASVQKQANQHAQDVIEHAMAINDALLEDGTISAAEHQSNQVAIIGAGNAIAANQGAGTVGNSIAKIGSSVALGVGALAVGVLLLFWGAKKVNRQ